MTTLLLLCANIVLLIIFAAEFNVFPRYFDASYICRSCCFAAFAAIRAIDYRSLPITLMRDCTLYLRFRALKREAASRYDALRF